MQTAVPSLPGRLRPGIAVPSLLLLLAGAPPFAAAQAPPGPLPPLEPVAAVRHDADGDHLPDLLDRRVRVRGTLASSPGMHDRYGRTAYLVDGASGVGLYADGGELDGLRPGDVLEVTGRAGSFRGAEQVRVEEITRLGGGPPPGPAELELPALLGEAHGGRLVRVRGTLGAAEGAEVRTRYSLVQEDAEVLLYLPEPIHGAPGFPLTAEDAGREVEVVGFASQYDPAEPYDSGYQLVPRSAEDVRFLRPVSPWSILAWGGAAALLGVLLGAILVYRRRTLRLHRESSTDPMTGLLNRRGYEAALRRAMQEARALRAPLALLVADLDNFKQANDQHGHLVGDAVLRAVARALREAVRSSDTICRYAGDEFVVLLPRVDEEYAMEVAGRIVERLRTVRTSGASGTLEIPLGASVGVAVFDGTEEMDAENLFRAADAALYQSKREGKGRARFALRAVS